MFRRQGKKSLVQRRFEMNTSNFTNNTIVNKLSSTNNILEITFFTSLAVPSVILNAIVFVAAFYVRNRSISTKFSVNLSISNLIAAVFIIPLYGQGDTWLLENNLCHAVLAILTSWRSSCVFLTTVFVFEGYMQMRRNYNVDDEESRTHNKDCLNVKVLILLLWISAAALGLFSAMSISITDNSLCTSYQHAHKELIFCYLTFIIIIPLLAMVCITVSHKRLSIRYFRSVGIYGGTPRTSLHEDTQYAYCASRLFYAIILLWAPHTIYMYCIIAWDTKTIYFSELMYKTIKTFQWLSYSSCLVQSLVIIKYNKQINAVVHEKLSNVVTSICGEEREEIYTEDEEANTFEVPTPRPLPKMFSYNKKTVSATNIEVDQA